MMEEYETENQKKIESDFKMLASLSHLCKLKEKELEEMKHQIGLLKKEINLLNLERKWCFDDDGNRITQSCEDQALEISIKLAEFPHLTEDVVKALRKKHTDLVTNLSELNAHFDALTEEIKRPYQVI
uniref:Uncharacterized protein n=1 Tax=Biomphalaria glabrata TaxID=6526 RepID=A0A2C9KUV1_BIOGL